MFATATRTALVAAALLGITAGTAMAAGASGTVQLKGTVALSCTVAVTDLNQTLNLTGGESNKQVGTVVENCNSGTGYNITVSSSNGGTLTAPGNGTQPINYTASYDGQSGSLSGSLVVARQNAQFNKSAALSVTIPANAQAIAGSYSDTVTITIASK